MRIVVTGREGQVVRSLVERASSNPSIEIIALGRPELDLADVASIAPAIVRARPNVVVSAAAYTAVDKAEDEPELAFRINEEGAGEVARAARMADASVIHLSTDYVFSGDHIAPYSEGMPTEPKSIYGASKLGGERAVADANPRHLIMRTAWVYSPFGDNFVKTMLKLAETRDRLMVVDDQRGNPTSALDIADAVLAVANRWRTGSGEPFGRYHFAGTGETTWCGFAREILATSSDFRGPSAEVKPIASREYPTRVERPRNSRLDSSRFALDFGFRAPPWRESVRTVVHRLLSSDRVGRQDLQ